MSTNNEKYKHKYKQRKVNLAYFCKHTHRLLYIYKSKTVAPGL